MIAALLLLATLARADEVATYDRLFGAEDAAPAESVERAELPSPWRLAGPAALAVVGLAGAWWLKKKGPAVTGAKPLAVVWRQPLGDRGTLVLVEVLDADGETRRLLIGTGGGPPSLVADLGTCLSVEVYADLPAVSPEVAAKVAAPKLAKATAPKFAIPTFATPKSAPKSAPRPAPGLATYAAFAAAADADAALPGAAVTSAVTPVAPLSTPATARAEAARNVARELLAERRRIAC